MKTKHPKKSVEAQQPKYFLITVIVVGCVTGVVLTAVAIFLLMRRYSCMGVILFCLKCGMPSFRPIYFLFRSKVPGFSHVAFSLIKEYLCFFVVVVVVNFSRSKYLLFHYFLCFLFADSMFYSKKRSINQ